MYVPCTKYQVQSRNSHFSLKFVIPIPLRIPTSTFKNQRPAFDIEKIVSSINYKVQCTKYQVQSRNSYFSSKFVIRIPLRIPNSTFKNQRPALDITRRGGQVARIPYLACPPRWVLRTWYFLHSTSYFLLGTLYMVHGTIIYFTYFY